jgi:pantoate--beta-alanine ligase
MIISTSVNTLQQILNKSSEEIHFIPTMGALHQGHLELIRQAKKSPGLIICSIFVNPKQFNDQNDLLYYPRTLAADIRLLKQNGCDVLFLPDTKEIYPENQPNYIDIQSDGLENVFEGAFRPGHFKGMLQVVSRLLHIVNPSVLFMGQKDYQQQLMVRYLLKQRFPDIRMVMVPTVREPNGLAMSSRNERLSQKTRQMAGLIYEQLLSISSLFPTDALENSVNEAKIELQNAGFEVEYLEIVDAGDLSPKNIVNPEDHVLICCAVQIEGVRLIDNILWPPANTN